MPVALAIGGAAIVGAAASNSAAKKSANAVTTAANNSNALQAQIYEQNRATAQPYIEGGNRSFAAWQQSLGLTPTTAENATGYGTYKDSLGYQSTLDEGLRAQRASSAAKGGLLSGDALKAATRYGATYANTFANGYSDRLFQGAQLGSNATNALSGVGSAYANSVSNNNMTAANAQANAFTNAGQTTAGLASNLAGAAAYGFGDNFGRTNALASSYGQTPKKSIFGGFG